jgi:RNA polymerase sigma factor (sigma-70 family)
VLASPVSVGDNQHSVTGPTDREEAAVSEILSFEDLVAGLRRGDKEAAWQFFARYADRLTRMAHKRLSRRAHNLADSSGLALEVLETVIRRASEGQIDLHSEKSLWGLFVRITMRKCGRLDELARKLREQPLPDPSYESAFGWCPADPNPTPAEAATLQELVEKALQQLPNDCHRTILQLRLQGYTVPEISKEVKRSENTVKWVLKEARKQLEWLLHEGVEKA